MELSEIKKLISEKTDENREFILRAADDILHTPELGYKETKTSAYVAEKAEELGLLKRTGIALTGVRSELGDPKSDINICVIGELDAVTCKTHPFSAPDGAAHACGHNGQSAVLLGVMKTLRDIGITDMLGGRITFLSVPAEEMIDLNYRKKLKEDGKITYYSGKQEMVKLGEFDDIDMCIMVHAQPGEESAAVYLEGSSLGFTASEITFHGKASHAGAFPWNGVNALNAAMLSMMNMHVSRESYPDEDKVRIHPILTKGGEAANVVPDEVIMENTVRAANTEALKFADYKAMRAVEAACIATDAHATVRATPGYLPLSQDHGLSVLFAENAKEFIPADKIKWGIDMIGSSDIGDISQLMPTIQPTVGGVSGSAHGADFSLSDPEASLIIPAKLIAFTIADLLFDGAKKAKEIKSSFKSKFGKKDYLAYLDSAEYTKEF